MIEQKNTMKMYNLPAEVKYCKKCTISNQRPRITFDEEGVCSACNFAEYKKTKFDWNKREVLLDIAKEERVHKGEFQRVIELLLPEETELMKNGASEVEEIRENLRNNNKNGITPTVGNLKGNYI